MLGRRSGLTPPSSATAEAGAACADGRKGGGGLPHRPLALLGICDRVIEAPIPLASPYRRLWRKVPEHPKTLGEHLRRVRIDRKMTNIQVAHVLGVAYQTVERWEHNRVPISPKSRLKIVAFIGYDPQAATGESNR